MFQFDILFKLEYTDDPWLLDLLAGRLLDEILVAEADDEDMGGDVVRVVGEHPQTTFKVDDLIAVLPDKSSPDPFWLAKITEIEEETLRFTYFHYKLNNKKNQVWSLHTTTGSLHFLDILVGFGGEETQLFTKKKSLRKPALKKINQAISIYKSK